MGGSIRARFVHAGGGSATAAAGCLRPNIVDSTSSAPASDAISNSARHHFAITALDIAANCALSKIDGRI
jgi:hypothetical protein